MLFKYWINAYVELVAWSELVKKKSTKLKTVFLYKTIGNTLGNIGNHFVNFLKIIPFKKKKNTHFYSVSKNR